MAADLAKIKKDLGELTLLEAATLVKELEEEWGVSAAAQAVAVAAPGGDDAGKAEEKTEFNVVLEAAGDKKIAVIKEVKNIAGLGLAEAKALVDGAPKVIKEGLPKAEAEALKKQLEDVGATVKLD